MRTEATMTDGEFLEALETCELPEKQFGHGAHVRAAYLYLQQGDFPEALGRMRRAIRAYSAHLGKPGRYHETITVAYLALIQQHIAERGHAGGWSAFERSNAELLDRQLLLKYYSSAVLESELARRVFVLPKP
jgi:tetratricopeptide (TPR) repeat protein